MDHQKTANGRIYATARKSEKKIPQRTRDKSVDIMITSAWRHDIVSLASEGNKERCASSTWR
ncbi:hypothetical protein Csa_022876 [Cucumis sativus]|uniref:Uncharacterized protein n=1 Tax=Cucumis sativus TaxID=3659 RepID=A0A0A0LSR6_CUCSA|nr:hypothetical protein Csa_022876 [Cucumis sativus]